MSGCERFGEEQLLQIEQGAPLDPHFASCPDCLAARARYDALKQDLAALRDQFAPPAHWQQAVLEQARPRVVRRRWLDAPTLAAAASVSIALAALLLPRHPAAAPSLEVRTQAAPQRTLRGAAAQAGDRLLLQASVAGSPQAELRVYRDDTVLVLRCSSAPPCRRDRDGLRAELVLAAPGNYQPLLLLSARALPDAQGSLDSDTAAAFAAGARAILGSEVLVR